MYLQKTKVILRRRIFSTANGQIISEYKEKTTTSDNIRCMIGIVPAIGYYCSNWYYGTLQVKDRSLFLWRKLVIDNPMLGNPAPQHSTPAYIQTIQRKATQTKQKTKTKAPQHSKHTEQQQEKQHKQQQSKNRSISKQHQTNKQQKTKAPPTK